MPRVRVRPSPKAPPSRTAAGCEQLVLDFLALPTIIEVETGARWRPIVFASGTADVGEVRGFTAVGIPVGIAASVSRTWKIVPELETLAGTGIPVFLDSGAFSEVEFGPQGASVVRPILEEDWEERLSMYDRLAAALGPQLLAVAPDRVGDQVATLGRLARYATRMRQISATGAHVLLPLQGGAMGAKEFYAAATQVLQFAPVPAFPMKKAATPPDAVLDFVRAVRPPRIHLLGLGIRNDLAEGLLEALHAAHPGMVVSMDANLIRSAVGRASGVRPYTAGQDAYRDEATGAIWGDCREPAFGKHLDYTDAIGEPDTWLSPGELRAIAEEVGLGRDERVAFVRDPGEFLNRPLEDEDHDGARWYEDPVMAAALDEAWARFAHRELTQPRKAAGIRHAFAAHPAAGQFVA